jgi:hypothetical protein
MVSCGHGREVVTLASYPPLLVMELPDLYGVQAPRLASQMFGVIFSAILLAIAVIQVSLIPRREQRFWNLLRFLALISFFVGFTRGDTSPYLGPLRLDQVLDLLTLGVAIGIGVLLQSFPPVLDEPVRQRVRRFEVIGAMFEDAE